MKYLVDTDIWSLWTIDNEPVASKAKQHQDDGIAISVVTVCEVFKGWIKKLNHCRHDQLITVFSLVSRAINSFRTTHVLNFDELALQHYQRLRQQYKGRDPFDLQIAAIALSRKLILVTNNTKDYEDIDGLKLENWNRPSS